MSSRRGLARGAALAATALFAGCGFGPGSSSKGTATLTVTRDYGARVMVDATDSDPSESDTVIRLLDRSAEITTRYGGGFVQSIDGLSGSVSDGRRSDWFFYVNGVESPVGAADVRVRGGDQIWWDFRDWTGAMSVPAVVGSWPEPFARASSGGDHGSVELECAGGGAACRTAAHALRGTEARLTVDRREADADPEAPRVVVGRWARVRDAAAVDGLRGGPAANGVFATFKGPVNGAYRLIALDSTPSPVRDLGPEAGLVAALRRGGGPVTWIVTGSGEPAVRRAAGLLNERALRNRYAVAALPGGRSVALPLR